jgi:hypothetical protein
MYTSISYINKNFWEELIAYLHLLSHVPHRKRRQQFFLATGTSLSRLYLATIVGDTQTLSDTSAQQFFYFCVYSMLRECVYGAVA